MAAVSAGKNQNNQVYLYEKNEKLGKKIFITGKGRCNLTNDCDILDFYKNIIRNSKFMYSSLSIFNNKNMKELLENNGLKLKTERGNRVYPLSDKSYDVTDTLKNIIIKEKVNILLNTEVIDIDIKNIDGKNMINSIVTKDVNNGEIKEISCDKLIIATGGLSYPTTGSTGDGYKFAKKLGIKIISPEPSLVGINVKENNECKLLSGLELKNVGIKLYKNNKLSYEDFGSMIFEDGYLDGPIILSTSCYLSNNEILDGNIHISIDLKPALDFETIDNRILREINNNKKGSIYDIIKTLLPIRFVDIFIDRLYKLYDIDAKLNNSNIKKEDRHNIIKLLKSFEYVIISKCGYDRAIVTRGGIDCKEINPKNMEVKNIKGLYFAGEVLDIDSMTGGFNLQTAFTTGFAAGKD